MSAALVFKVGQRTELAPRLAGLSQELACRTALASIGHLWASSIDKCAQRDSPAASTLTGDVSRLLCALRTGNSSVEGIGVGDSALPDAECRASCEFAWCNIGKREKIDTTRVVVTGRIRSGGSVK